MEDYEDGVYQYFKVVIEYEGFCEYNKVGDDRCGFL